MALLTRSNICGLLRLRESCIRVPSVIVQLRWKKEPKRKPRWLPMAKSKVFRIPVHPYVPPDEKELIEKLVHEYFRKIESLRKLFKVELEQKSKDEGHSREFQLVEEENFRLLLEENKKENERIKKIREETMENLFQEKQLELLQLEENRKIKEQQTKMRIEEIVRKEKERTASFITYDNIDVAIEKAINDPRNFNYAIDVNGDVKWEGNPPAELEENLKRQIAQSLES